MYSVYQVIIQPNIATQYTKHRKKCVCSKWEYIMTGKEKRHSICQFFVEENVLHSGLVVAKTKLLAIEH